MQFCEGQISWELKCVPAGPKLAMNQNNPIRWKRLIALGIQAREMETDLLGLIFQFLKFVNNLVP